MQEIEDKVERLARLATARGLAGILLNTQPNFAWLTAGRSNQIDGSRENGSGSLLVSARGERFVVANNIEMPRLQDEALSGLGFTPCEYAWTDEQAQPGTPISSAKQLVFGEIGCDNALPGGMPIEPAIAATRALLTPAEVDRYRALGRDVGRAVGEVCRALAPGTAEIDIARQAAAAIAQVGARAIVTLVAADDRIGRFRHPVPTPARWQRPGDGRRLRAASRAGRGAVADRRRRKSPGVARRANSSDGRVSSGGCSTPRAQARLGRTCSPPPPRRTPTRGFPAKKRDIIRAARPATVPASGSRTLRPATRSKSVRRLPGIPASPGRRSRKQRWSRTTGWKSSPRVQTGRRFRCRFGANRCWRQCRSTSNRRGFAAWARSLRSLLGKPLRGSWARRRSPPRKSYRRPTRSAYRTK